MRSPLIRLLLKVTLVLAVVLGAGIFTAGCLHMDKAEIEARLLALDKNGSIRAVGMSRAPFAVEEGGASQEGTYFVIPAKVKHAGASPLVLVHGTPSSLFNWSLLLTSTSSGQTLNETRDVYALDVIGHGVTTATRSSYSFQACAEYIAAFLDALDLQGVCLVGNSYGGEMAWRVAIDRPDLVRRLVLIDASGYARTEEQFLPEEVAMREMSVAKYGWLLNSRDRILTALQPHFGAPVPADSLEEMFLVCQNADNWGAMVDLARDENGHRAEELRTLIQPTLLLWGDRDIAYPVDLFGRRFLDDLPDARLHVLPDCGHYPHEEEPSLVVRQILDFVEHDA